MSSAGFVRLGIIGLSEGNGHPYSWSAICNGYDPGFMSACPFPAIPQYLGRRSFPRDQLVGARVTHVWTQDVDLSRHIARAALIPNVVRQAREMLGHIDALLLARDDAENHHALAAPFLSAGLPVYIDKPPALSVRGLEALYAAARRPEQIFSCSALRYAQELRLTAEESQQTGVIRHVRAATPKSWARYAAHIVDPTLTFLAPGSLARATRRTLGPGVRVDVRWGSGLTGELAATGLPDGDILLEYVGERGTITKVFADSFSAFRASLAAFLRVAAGAAPPELPMHLRRMVELIEIGCEGELGPSESAAHRADPIAGGA